MKKRKIDSVFTNNSDIWIPVYGIPTALGLLMLFDSTTQGFGALLIGGVIGSFLCISAIEAFSNWID